MKKCLRQKCQKDFEPNKPKQVFCSAKCRVYFSREEKVQSVTFDIKDLNTPINQIKPLDPKGAKKSNLVIDTTQKKQMPEGLDKFQKLRWLRENS